MGDIQGDLEKYPVSKIINYLYYEELTGKLFLKYDDDECEVIFINGKIKKVLMEGFGQRDGYEEILKWDKGEFEFIMEESTPEIDSKTIEAPGDEEVNSRTDEGDFISKGVETMNMEDMKDTELLRYVVSEVDGAVAAGLINMDGLTMGVYNTIDDFDTTAADAEFASMLHSARKAAENLGPAIGEVEELILTGTNAMVIVRMIGDDYYTGIALEKGGNIGKARLMQKKVVKVMYPRYYGEETT